MTCQEVRENLGAYLQQKLSSDELATIKQHVGECLICAHELENLRQADIALSHYPSIEPSRSFDARLFARLDELEIKSREKWFSWGRIMAGRPLCLESSGFDDDHSGHLDRDSPSTVS